MKNDLVELGRAAVCFVGSRTMRASEREMTQVSYTLLTRSANLPREPVTLNVGKTKTISMTDAIFDWWWPTYLALACTLHQP